MSKSMREQLTKVVGYKRRIVWEDEEGKLNAVYGLITRVDSHIVVEKSYAYIPVEAAVSIEELREGENVTD